MSRSTYITFAVYLAVLIVVWLGVWPLWQDIQSARASVASLQAQVAHEEDVIGRLAELEQTISQSSERIAEIEEAIPSQRHTAEVIAVFEEAATSNGLSLSNIAISNPAQRNTSRTQDESSSSVLDSFSAHLELSGRYGAFASFLDQVETSFPLLDISTVSFSIPPLTGSQEENEANLQNPVLEFSIGLQAYYNEQ